MTFITTINTIISIIQWIIIIRVVLSWFPNFSHNAFGKFIFRITEPLLAPIRKLLHGSSVGGGMMLDFSPIVLFIILWILQPILDQLVMMFIP